MPSPSASAAVCLHGTLWSPRIVPLNPQLYPKPSIPDLDFASAVHLSVGTPRRRRRRPFRNSCIGAVRVHRLGIVPHCALCDVPAVLHAGVSVLWMGMGWNYYTSLALEAAPA